MIDSVYEPNVYTSNGTEDTYDIDFDYFNDEDNIKVSVEDADTGELTVLVNPTNYTVDTDANTITLDSGSIPDNGLSIAIELNMNFLQEVDFVENSAAPAESFENVLDKATLELQQLSENIGRAVSWSVVEGESDELGTMAYQNSDGVAITGGTISGLDTPLAIASGGTGGATASAARTNLGLGTISTQNANNVNISGGTVVGTALNITGLTEDVSPIPSTDYTITYDASAGTNKKVKLENLVEASVNLVDDTSPQLGGNLDLNTFSIVFPTATVSDADTSTSLGTSNTKVPTQNAVKSYVDTQIAAQTKVSLIPIFPDLSTTLSTSTTTYLGNTKVSTTVGDVEPIFSMVVPFAGTISACYIQLSHVPGSAKSYTFTVRKNGSDTSMTVAISGNSVFDGSTTSNTFSVVQGDKISLKSVPSGTPTAARAQISLAIQSS